MRRGSPSAASSSSGRSAKLRPLTVATASLAPRRITVGLPFTAIRASFIVVLPRRRFVLHCAGRGNGSARRGGSDRRRIFVPVATYGPPPPYATNRHLVRLAY